MNRTFDDLKRDVDLQGGLATTSMSPLREMIGNKNLTAECCRKISSRLQGVGLGHLPRVLLREGDSTVVVYTQGSPAGVLIEAVVRMCAGHDLVESIAAVRQAVNTPHSDAEERLAQVRAIVGDLP
jgi:hypothetical protein